MTLNKQPFKFRLKKKQWHRQDSPHWKYVRSKDIKRTILLQSTKIFSWKPRENKWHRDEQNSSLALELSTAVACVSGAWQIWFLSSPFLVASETSERERASKRQSSLSFSRQPAKAAVSLRSPPLGTSIVEHFNRKVIQRFPAFQVLIILTIVFLCQNVKITRDWTMLTGR